MTVSSTTARVSYSGNGSTTAFTVPFYFLDSTHLKVVLRSSTGAETVQILATNYTVSGAGVASGGTVTMNTAPSTGTTVVILRNAPLTQLVDYQANDPFPAETHERALDQLTMEAQQITEAVGRSIKLSSTNTMASTEFTVAAADRAGKVLGFDTSGELSVTQELGSYRGNWATGTAYAERDLVKDSSNSNIYLCLTAHTSSGTTPILSNADSAKWALIVDAATAGSASTSAAASAALANDWATKTSGPVAGGEYSAKYNAQAAATSASSASTSASSASASASSASSSATTASTAATNASNSATSAAASAVAAAAAAASGMYKAVVDKSADYTVPTTEGGYLYRMNTASAALTVTLPSIASVTDGFRVTVVKWSSDSNSATVVSSGSDTINGGSSYPIATQYSAATFVADLESATWFAQGAGFGATNFYVNRFSGNGSTTAFTLTNDPGSSNATYVFVSGVYQQKNTYTVSGTTLTFSSAPPSGTNNIEVVYTQALAIGTPSDDTVTTAKIVDDAVTTAKLAANAVTAAKVASDVATTAGTQTLQNKTISDGTFSSGYTEGSSASNTGTNYAITFGQGSLHILTLTGNCTFTFPTPTVGKGLTILLKQDATGSRTVTWPSSVKWPSGTAPTITATASKGDKYTFVADGTYWWGSNAGQNYL